MRTSITPLCRRSIDLSEGMGKFPDQALRFKIGVLAALAELAEYIPPKL